MSVTLPLSDPTIRELYQAFEAELQSGLWAGWEDNVLAYLERARNWTDDELRSVEVQTALWEEQQLGSVGMGRSVNTRAIYDDDEVLTALVELRRREWPGEDAQRANAIQGAFNQLRELLKPRLDRQPRAKLLRAFATLLPAELHCGFNYDARKHVSALLLGKAGKSVRDVVLARARLRAALGPEDSLRDHARRSIFCWWLHDRHDSILAGDGAAPRPIPVSGPPAGDDEEPPLAMYPFHRQRKGLPALRGHVDNLRALISSCEGGASQDEVVAALREEHGLEHLQTRSFRILMNTAKALGLVTHRDGLWFPSDAGEQTLDTDPPDILVRRLLERVFGMALIVRTTTEAEGSVARSELIAVLRQAYPRWQSDFAAGSLIAWARSVDLIERHDASSFRATDYGRAWAEKLPEDLPEAPADDLGPGPGDEGVEPGSDGDRDGPPPWTPPRFTAMWQQFGADSQLAHFVFDQDQVQALHIAWHPVVSGKRFAILSGLSGTGKTAILRHYARLYCGLVGIEDWQAHVAVIAVSPDWRDPSSLLGYLSVLGDGPTYVNERALGLLLDADRNRHQPYFLILDEMNLAHPEHYFAPFLSAMETRDHIDVHDSADPVIDVPRRIRWPENLFIGGTVNIDETTHSFSDKVLDRAFTIEFWSIDLDTYFARRGDGDRGDVAQIDAVYGFFRDLNTRLAAVRRHVGYRSIAEALDFIRSGARDGLVQDDDSLWSLVDLAVHAKVLPRLRGHDTEDLRGALNAAHQLCQERLPRCAAKLQDMLQRLEVTGVTRFFS